VRVLLVRLDGIGDAAVCVPLVASLLRAGHQVGVALTTRNAGLFSSQAVVAEHVLERIPWPAHGSTAESTLRARAEIATMRYDVALIASEEPEAYVLAAGIATRVGFSTGWTRPLKSLWVRRRVTRAVPRAQRLGAGDEHEVEVLYRLGTGLVADLEPPADATVTRRILLGSDRLIRRGLVLQAGPKWSASGVDDTTLRTIVEALQPYGLRVVAAPADAAVVKRTIGTTPETFSSLRAWIAAIDSATCVVTVDTGAAHVAGMLGVPVADVFPDAHFAAQVRRWRPWTSSYTAFRASEVVGGGPSRLIEAVRDGL
jgi:ADP-heptose:LPS heptosyltransferase